MATEIDKCPIVNAEGWRAALKRWRRRSRQRLNRLLTRFFGTTQPNRRPLANDTRSILVVRLNKRLGNILFLTPMLRCLTATLPAAAIDVLVQDPAHKPLLESLPGIRRVLVQEKSVSRVLRLTYWIRRQHYDLAIDPSGNSTSNRLALAFSGARQRMGFAAQNQWLRLTHAGPRPRSRHQARQGVQLLETAVSEPDFACFDTLVVSPSVDTQAAASTHWQHVFGTTPQSGPVIGFFTQATGAKQLSTDWWQAWHEHILRTVPNARFLQICPPGPAAGSGLSGTIPRVAIEPLDELAAVLSRLHVFVAADSGPMHLAAAAGAPVVGLFRATSPAAYAPLGRACVSLWGDALTSDKAALAVKQILEEQRHSKVA